MSLGNAHIEGALWHGLHHDVHGATCRHSWRDTHNLGILFGQFQ